MNRKLLAVIGSFAMLLGILPGSVFAAAPVSPAPDPSVPSTVYLPILFAPASPKSSFELITERSLLRYTPQPPIPYGWGVYHSGDRGG